VHTVVGHWPEIGSRVDRADVVVAHDVVYNVGPGIVEFLTALSSHAHRKVVLALPERHPWTWLTPYFEQLHGLGRPTRPTAALLVDVLRELGADPVVSGWDEPVAHGRHDALVERVARRCCVPAGRRQDVEDAVWRTPPPTVRAMVAIHWDPAA
jgi:hypothetical protein